LVASTSSEHLKSLLELNVFNVALHLLAVLPELKS